MHPSPYIDRSSFDKCWHALRRPATALFAGALLAGVLTGCATTASDTGTDKVADPDETAAARAKPARPARVEVEADVGFTVTEVVSISGDVRNKYRQALSLIAQEDYEGGIALLLDVVDKVPDATAPLVDLGMAYGQMGSFEKAESTLNDAVRATPDHPVAHNELGIVYRKQGKFARARASYERALEIYPGFHYARRNLAVLCDLYLADLSCALEQYELYQAAVSGDREVDIWISDIRNRVAPDGAPNG
jgi:Flp pilus assembly protein TadD